VVWTLRSLSKEFKLRLPQLVQGSTRLPMQDPVILPMQHPVSGTFQ
jgi:hypothetical protein